MTLSLDDVRNMRFRMARKSGYEVLEVDEFVDQVEETFAQLIEENQNLKRQVESLKSSAPSEAPKPAAQTAPAAPAKPAESGAASEGTLVVTTSKEASSAVVRLVEMSANQAEQLVSEATDEAARIKDEADRAAHQMTTDARTRAERVESEARVSAERVQADAIGRSEQLDREIVTRRRDMFSQLERQRDDLSAAVTDLRSFEETYRTNLTKQLQGHIESVRSGKAEPDEVPSLAQQQNQPTDKSAGQESAPADEAAADSSKATSSDEPARGEPARDDAPTLGGGSSSSTPRLDALLGDQH